MDFSKSSRNAWSLLRRLRGAAKRTNTKSKIKVDLIAQKAPSDKAFTREIRKKYRRLRRGKAHLSRPFTLGEIDQALTKVKQGKAAGFDGIYPEFLTHTGKHVRMWLANFFTDCLMKDKLPPIFKKSKVIALLKPGKLPEDPSSYRPISEIQAPRKNCAKSH